MTTSYWARETEIMDGVLEQPDVVQALRNALSTFDPVRVESEADAFVDALLAPIAFSA